jgi:LysR family transcriptional regulator, glycine cleavage system transcriptional activator
MVRHLPPFAPLVAFDAVARHRSFTRAAEELGVTQSAVSHQIRRLERFYGVQLLLRLNPGVELTAEGTILRGELAILLDNIAGLTPRLRRRPGLRTIRLGAGTALAGWWLVRRLPSFQQAHPDITVEFEPIGTEQDAARSVDLRIVWTSLVEARPNSTQAPLFQERVVPVCAPCLLPGGKPLADPADLAELPLIQKGAGPTGEWSWEFWFKALALHRTVPRGPVLRDLGLCLTSAVEGGGVALGRSLLIADAVADGRLMPALSATPRVSSSKVHVARWRPELIGDRVVQLVVNWLARESSLTIASDADVQPAAL